MKPMQMNEQQTRLQALNLGDRQVMVNPLTGEEVSSFDVVKDANEINQANQPSSVREYLFFNSLRPEEQQQYLSMKRSSQIMNLGGKQAVYNPLGGGIKESFAVTPKPEQMPEFKGQQAYATNIGKEQAAKEIAMPKTTASFNSAVAKSDRVSNLINEITPRVGSLTAGFGGSLLSKIPGTGASDLKANLDTLEANMGFNELQEMRNNSPTGGALGAISERELALLTSAVSNVRQSQSPEQLRENLSKLNQELQNSKQRIVEAYNQDKARFGSNSMPSINGFVGGVQNMQPSNNYQEGITATHPTTGQKLIFRGGQWQDM